MQFLINSAILISTIAAVSAIGFGLAYVMPAWLDFSNYFIEATIMNLKTITYRFQLYLLKRQIVKYDLYIAHLKNEQRLIISTVFAMQADQTERRAQASLIQQMLDVPTLFTVPTSK